MTQQMAQGRGPGRLRSGKGSLSPGNRNWTPSPWTVARADPGCPPTQVFPPSPWSDGDGAGLGGRQVPGPSSRPPPAALPLVLGGSVYSRQEPWLQERNPGVPAEPPRHGFQEAPSPAPCE